MSLRNGMAGLVARLQGTEIDSQFKDADYVMSSQDKHIIVEGGSTVIAITLPKVAEAKGRIYSIETVTGAGDTVTISSAGDCLNAIADTDCDANKDLAVYYSTGRDWIKIGAIAN